MDCNQTMMFFLTGGEVTQYSGFSNDATRPFDNSAASQTNRKGKYFDIPFNRLEVDVNNNRTGRYVDPWGTPYMYIAPVDGKTYSDSPGRTEWGRQSIPHSGFAYGCEGGEGHDVPDHFGGAEQGVWAGRPLVAGGQPLRHPGPGRGRLLQL